MTTGSSLTTTTALLEGLFEASNDSVWRTFDARYRPVIVGFAGRLGLGPADADDVAQETLTQFIRDYRAGKYDRSRGRLSAWIVGIARHRAADLLRARAARRERRGESAFGELPGDEHLSELWEQECRQAVLLQAMAELASSSKLNARTIEAFRRHVLDQRTPEDVARELGISVRSVYLAKHRCLTRLRGILSDLSAAYELDGVAAGSG